MFGNLYGNVPTIQRTSSQQAAPSSQNTVTTFTVQKDSALIEKLPFIQNRLLVTYYKNIVISTFTTIEESYFYIKLFPLCDGNIFTFNFHSNRDGKN